MVSEDLEQAPEQVVSELLKSIHRCKALRLDDTVLPLRGNECSAGLGNDMIILLQYHTCTHCICVCEHLELTSIIIKGGIC